MKSILSKYYYYLYKITYKIGILLSKRSVSYGIALMYHYVTDEDVDTIEPCKCKVKIFENTLLSLKEEGYIFVSVDQCLTYIKQKTPIKYALVTFDDVPECVYYNAYPILKRLRIPFVLFVTTDYLDKQGYLTTAQLKEMDNNPLCLIGAHTVSHPMLRKVRNSWDEMKKSKDFLEKILGHSIDYMAYPYGLQTAVSIKVMRQAKKIGYKCAFGTVQVPISDILRYFLFYLPRIVRN